MFEKLWSIDKLCSARVFWHAVVHIGNSLTTPKVGLFSRAASESARSLRAEYRPVNATAFYRQAIPRWNRAILQTEFKKPAAREFLRRALFFSVSAVGLRLVLLSPLGPHITKELEFEFIHRCLPQLW